MGLKFYQTSYNLINPIKVSAVSTSTLSAQIGPDIETVRVVGDVDYWLAKGSSTITAGSSVGSGSTFHPGGVVEYINTSGKRYFAIEAEGATGFVSIAPVTQ